MHKMVNIDEVIDCLNKERIRATYKAVGEVIGCIPLEVQDHLQAWNCKRNLKPEERDPRTSWVVRANDGEPTGYRADQKHRDLHHKAQIIKSGVELNALLRRCA